MTTEPIDLDVFTGWVTFAGLPTADVPTGPGVYVIVRFTDDPPAFLDVSSAGHFKGKDPTVPIVELHRLWVPGTRIVYIGKANHGSRGKRGLRKRLDEFRRFGAGEPVGHSGGRRIWQLADHTDLLVGWHVTDDAEAARIETDMIAQFHAHHGRLLPVIERDDVVVIGGDDDGSMRTAPLGVLSGAVVVSVTGSSPR